MKDAAQAASVPNRDRRHEGCGQKQRRWDIHQHYWHRDSNCTRANWPRSVEVRDAVLVSGDLGAHGIAVLSVRAGLEFDGPVLSQPS